MPVVEQFAALAATERSAADEAILDAALEQFCVLGIRRTSADDIARRAGVNRATLYRRIGPMNAVVDAVLVREIQRLMADVERRTSGLADPRDRMVEGFVHTMHVIRTHPLLTRLLLVERDDVLPQLTVDAAPLLDLSVSFVALQIERVHRELGTAPPEDLVTVAELLTRLTHSFVLTPRLRIDLESDERLRSFARAHLLPFVFDRPRPESRP